VVRFLQLCVSHKTCLSQDPRGGRQRLILNPVLGGGLASFVHPFAFLICWLATVRWLGDCEFGFKLRLNFPVGSNSWNFIRVTAYQGVNIGSCAGFVLFSAFPCRYRLEPFEHLKNRLTFASSTKYRRCPRRSNMIVSQTLKSVSITRSPLDWRYAMSILRDDCDLCA